MKKQLGQFMTPAHIARIVAKELGVCDTVLDFAVGEGALLQAVQNRACKQVRLVGFDVDPHMVAISSELLNCAEIRQANGLTAKLPRQLSGRIGVVGNPPFLSKVFKGSCWVHKAFAGVDGKLGLDRAEVQFLARSLVAARSCAGRVVMLMPVGFADGDVYRRIRAFLMEQYQLLKCIEITGGRNFINTEARTVLLVIDTEGAGNVETEICELGCHDTTPKRILKMQLAPGTRLDARYHKAMLIAPSGIPTLNDLAVTINRGVLSRKEAENLRIDVVHTTHLSKAKNHRLAIKRFTKQDERLLTAKEGDILLPRTGSRVRWEPVLMRAGEAPITDHVFRIRASETDRDIVYRSLCHPAFSHWLRGTSKGVCATVLTKRELLQMPLFAAVGLSRSVSQIS